MMPPTFSHRLSRPSRQAWQTPQVLRAVHHHWIADLEAADACADRGDLAGSLDADDQRHLPLGESHAAKAPQVEMIERDRLDADLHLAGAGSERMGHLAQFELAVAEQRERAHRRRHAGSRPITSETFWPPKPNELEMA